MSTLARLENVILEYQGLIDSPPVSTEKLWQAACSNDGTTIDYWKETWLKNIAENHKRFGPFSENPVGKLFSQFRYKPAICAGSGPSLKRNAHLLKDRKGIALVSCLHNFHYFEDLEANVDYYCTLDSGDVTIEEVTEGGKRTAEEYWALTEGRALVAFTGTSPRLIEKWRGKVYWFNATIPNEPLQKEIDAIEPFHQYMSNGGNVLGACVYLAKAILGCGAIAFIGADFSFGYPVIEDNQARVGFHTWKSKYDNQLGRYIRVTDVFGNKVPTWNSYYNFKKYFDFIAQKVPGPWVNCTEGGCLGSYPEGNISCFRYMDLKDWLQEQNISDLIAAEMASTNVLPKKILY